MTTWHNHSLLREVDDIYRPRLGKSLSNFRTQTDLLRAFKSNALLQNQDNLVHKQQNTFGWQDRRTVTMVTKAGHNMCECERAKG